MTSRVSLFTYQSPKLETSLGPSYPTLVMILQLFALNVQSMKAIKATRPRRLQTKTVKESNFKSKFGIWIYYQIYNYFGVIALFFFDSYGKSYFSIKIWFRPVNGKRSTHSLVEIHNRGTFTYKIKSYLLEVYMRF